MAKFGHNELNQRAIKLYGIGPMWVFSIKSNFSEREFPSSHAEKLQEPILCLVKNFQTSSYACFKTFGLVAL